MSSNLSLFGRLLKSMTDIAAGVAAFGVLVVVLLQVAGRLLGAPVSWSEEATRYLFVWMIFLGLAAGFRTVETARVTVLLALFPRAIRRLSVPIYATSSIAFFLLAGWTGYKLARQQFMMNETAATLAVPMWLIGTIMPVSAVLAILAIIESLRHRRDLIEVLDPAFDAPETNLAPTAILRQEKES